MITSCLTSDAFLLTFIIRLMNANTIAVCIIMLYLDGDFKDPLEFIINNDDFGTTGLAVKSH